MPYNCPFDSLPQVFVAGIGHQVAPWDFHAQPAEVQGKLDEKDLQDLSDNGCGHGGGKHFRGKADNEAMGNVQSIRQATCNHAAAPLLHLCAFEQPSEQHESDERHHWNVKVRSIFILHRGFINWSAFLACMYFKGPANTRPCL